MRLKRNQQYWFSLQQKQETIFVRIAKDIADIDNNCRIQSK